MSQLAAILRKDRCTFRNTWRVLARQSLFKVGFILLFASGLLGGLYMLFLEGFTFLSSFGGAGFIITRRLFSLFFLGLGIMLLLSSILSSYSTLFRSREVPFLLTGPFDIENVILYKFLEAASLSSWAFFFVIIPFASAYAWHESLGLAFGLWTLMFSIPFLLLCSGLGTLVTLVAVRWLPRGRVLWGGVLLIGGWLLYVGVIREVDHASENPAFLLARLVPGLKLASQPLMPSWWTAEGIKCCSEGQVGRGLLLWSVLMSNMLMLCLVVRGVGRRLFYPAYQRVVVGTGRTRRSQVLLRRLEQALGFAARDVRGMMMKDIRTFLRDPMQWSQALIFFGLLGLYFASIRSFHYNRLPSAWRNLVTFLNVFSVAAVQCSLASRFVFPQLSLEGQAFWMLGLSPTTAGRILMTKFVTSLLGMMAVSGGLIVLSARMLGVSGGVMGVAVVLVLAVSSAVCGLSTGLGAVFMDLKSQNPAAIVSGFGGTVNLVLSLVFMLAGILPFGLIFHLSAIGHLPAAEFPRYVGAAMAWLVLITAVATSVPLWFGRRSLKNRDY